MEKLARIGVRHTRDNNMETFSPMQVVVSDTFSEAADFISTMDNDKTICRFLPEDALEDIEGLDNIIFIMIGNYERRRDLYDIYRYAHQNNFKMFYVEYTEILYQLMH